ncbi:MAG TPA: sugar ABC transporter permease [bacterium]|jgi:multiple sugar transport system permease protein|nr:sugar ABC transporter permease [bacterium]HOK29698.1 sugar ABC transporter permease [bacterium]HOL55120.1 sugar ABC transporter permease [bacterium]HOP55987.1 sugar ABC transporter permease [bacterium]HPC77046.1 sugar ABC transporter permease [bacterium]
MKLKSLNYKKKNILMSYIAISPWLIGFAVFFAFPLLFSIVLSFLKWSFNGSTFIWLDNYKEALFNDGDFWYSLGVTLGYGAISIPFTILFSFLLSLLINQKVKGIGFFRMVYFLPVVAASDVVVAKIGPEIFSRMVNVNVTLESFGIQLSQNMQNFISLFSTMLTLGLWRVGIQMLIFLAGLQSIDPQVYEAAEIDGASWWKSLWSITIPLLGPFTIINIVFTVIESFTNVFTIARVLAQGRSVTPFFMDYVYRLSFEEYRLGYGAAVSWIFLIIVISVVLLVYYYSQRYLIPTQRGE